MSYTPTEWKSGDVITSEKLNNLEQGVADASGGGGGGGALIVHESDSAFDKTWQEIFDALSAGQIVISLTLDEYEATMAVLFSAYKVGSKYRVDMYSYTSSASFVYETLSADGYPTYSE